MLDLKYYILPNGKIYLTEKDIADNEGISLTELTNVENPADPIQIVKQAVKLIAVKHNYTEETLKQLELKQMILSLITKTAHIRLHEHGKAILDTADLCVKNALEYLGLEVKDEYTWAELDDAKFKLNNEILMVKCGLNIRLTEAEQQILNLLLNKMK